MPREVQRSADRRVRGVSLHVPDRRLGFDRRMPPEGSWRARYRRMLEGYRDNPDTVAVALAVFFLLNIADLILTVNALSLGAQELNPIMAHLFVSDPVMAALFKVGVGAAIALFIWFGRRYRRMLEASLVLVALMTLVLLYHGVGAALIGG